MEGVAVLRSAMASIRERLVRGWGWQPKGVKRREVPRMV